MRRGLKGILVGMGIVAKLFGVPQNAHCPTANKFYGKEKYCNIYENIKYESGNYSTINLKREYRLYDICDANQ